MPPAGSDIETRHDIPALRERCRVMKQAVYDRDPSFCKQPWDGWLDRVLKRSAAAFSENGQALTDAGTKFDLLGVTADNQARDTPDHMSGRRGELREFEEGFRRLARAVRELGSEVGPVGVIPAYEEYSLTP